MKHIKPFMESVGVPKEYTWGKISKIMQGQVIDEITPSEINKISRAIADSGLEGTTIQYQCYGPFGEMTYNKKSKKDDPVHNFNFTGYWMNRSLTKSRNNLWWRWRQKPQQLPVIMEIYKTTDDWWVVSFRFLSFMTANEDKTWYMCDGINQVVDLIRTMRQIKPFMESAGHPREYTGDQVRAIMSGQVIDEIMPSEINKISRAIADSGLEGTMNQYQCSGKFAEMTFTAKIKPDDPVHVFIFNPKPVNTVWWKRSKQKQQHKQIIQKKPQKGGAPVKFGSFLNDYKLSTLIRNILFCFRIFCIIKIYL